MIAGLMLARSESWCLGLTLRAASLYCDAVVFTDDRSDDRTREIIDEVRAETGLVVDYRRVDEGGERWDEMDLRQEQLVRGRRLGASHFVIVDADELPTANAPTLLKSLVGRTPPGEARALPMVSTYHSVHARRVDGHYGRASRLTWCFGDDPTLSWAPEAGYQHHMRTPRNCRTPRPPFMAGAYSEDSIDLNWGGIFHLQFVSRERLAAKAVWYKIMETIRWPGRMSAAELNRKYDWTLHSWNGTPDDPPQEIVPIPDEWWRGYVDRGWHRYLDPSAEPWQAREARRLYAEHVKVAPQAFDGLALHGVIHV